MDQPTSVILCDVTTFPPQTAASLLGDSRQPSGISTLIGTRHPPFFGNPSGSVSCMDATFGSLTDQRHVDCTHGTQAVDDGRVYDRDRCVPAPSDLRTST